MINKNYTENITEPNCEELDSQKVYEYSEINNIDDTNELPVNIKTYRVNLPSNLDILDKVDLGKGANAVVKEHVKIFFSIFQKVINEKAKYYSNSIIFPAVRFHWLEDESAQIEWVFNDFKYGFSIEPEIEESSWYYISNKNFDEEHYYKLLRFEKLELLLNNLIDEVVEYL